MSLNKCQVAGTPGTPGILREFSKRGKLRELSGNSVQYQGKIVTKYLCSSFKYLCKTAVERQDYYFGL